MWTLKEGRVFAVGVEYEGYYVENEQGVKLVSVDYGRHLEEGMEKFEYQERDLSFQVTATRVETNTSAGQEVFVMTDCYRVWLGIALHIASIRRPLDFITLERGRSIARNIREALLVWRYPPGLADFLSCHSSAHDVVFIMTGWEKWDPSPEGNWLLR